MHGARASVPRDHDDLHRRDRARSARSAGPRLRRRGQDPVRRRAHPAARQGLAVPTRTPASTRPTSAPPTSHQRACSTASSGTCGSPRSPHRPCCTKFEATFDTYWNSAEFESYDPDRDRDRLDDALAEANGRKRLDRVTISLSGLEVRPYPYQQEMLDALEVERRRPRPSSQPRRRRNGHRQDRHRRTRLPTALQRMAIGPRLLFVAHRREILEQSLRTYREVLGDGDFGELYVGGARPERWKHVFASVQSLHVVRRHQHPQRCFDVVVIDEFHHAEAQTYRRMLDHLDPRELLGLTATPERADGLDVRGVLRRTHRGRAAAVGRARARTCSARSTTSPSPTAPTCGPISGARAGTTKAQLSNVYTGNDARAAHRAQQLARQGRRRRARCVRWASASASPTPSTWRESFNEAGIPARAVSGRHSATRAARRADRPARARGQHPLRRRPVQRGPRPPGRRHGAVPAADGERHDLPAAARPRAAPHAATRPC